MSIRDRAAAKARRIRDGFRESQRNRALVAEARRAPRPDLEAAYQRIVHARGEGYTHEQRNALVNDLLSSRLRTRSEMAAIRAIQRGRDSR